MRGTQKFTQIQRALRDAESLLKDLSERALSGSMAGTSGSFARQSGTASELSTLLRSSVTSRQLATLAGRRTTLAGLTSTGTVASAAARLGLKEARQFESAVWKRLFSSEPPRKGWEKFYPKGKGRRPAAQAKNPKGKIYQKRDFF